MYHIIYLAIEGVSIGGYMIYKKSVVLTSVRGGKEKAVLTLEYDAGEANGSVRLYNFNKEPDGILSVGILNNKKVLKAGLSKVGTGVYTFKISTDRELNSFSCALVNFVQGEVTPLLQGSTNGITLTEEKLCNSLSVFEEEPKIQKVEQVLNNNGVFWDDEDESEQEIEQIICDDGCVGKCSECIYRDAFFKMEDDTSEFEQKEETFFDGIRDQIDSLFKKYPEEMILKQLIPDSKWVKIDYEDINQYYVVGLLYEANNIKYVCYGVPSLHRSEPPEELSGLAQWLPIDSNKENGFGYWITYQDAETGENVKLNYEII